MKNILFTLALLVSFSSCEQTPDAVYTTILQGLQKGLRQSAITGFNERAISKMNLKDYNGAIADLTKVIDYETEKKLGIPKEKLAKKLGITVEELENRIHKDYLEAETDDYTLAYYNRGLAKHNLKDYNGAIADYTKAIELDPNNSLAYTNRGISKDILGDLNGACDDAKKVANLGDTDAAKWVAENCN